MSTRCFWLEPIGQARLYLRRAVVSGEGRCALAHGYHDARQSYVEVPARYVDGTYMVDGPRDRRDVPADVVWPTACACGYAFTATDLWQVFAEPLYRRGDTGAIVIQDEAGPGAMWDAEYLHDQPQFCGPDGRSVHVVLPNGRVWHIDGRASNCTDPGEWTHRCWVRHGEPPNVTVDKKGHTCRAGAGSIQAGDYHGFLQQGVLT